MISLVDFGLHVGVAIFMQMYHYGEHQLFWAFICLALLSNLVALVGYVARNVDSIEDRDGNLIPSDLQLKFKQRPEECVLVLMLGIVSTESLCFLSKEQHDHKNFRMLGLLSNVIEGIPMLALQIVFLYKYGWLDGQLVAVGLFWTMCTLVLKLLRGWLIFLTQSCEEEARILTRTRTRTLILTLTLTLTLILTLTLTLTLTLALTLTLVLTRHRGAGVRVRGGLGRRGV